MLCFVLSIFPTDYGDRQVYAALAGFVVSCAVTQHGAVCRLANLTRILFFVLVLQAATALELQSKRHEPYGFSFPRSTFRIVPKRSPRLYTIRKIIQSGNVHENTRWKNRSNSIQPRGFVIKFERSSALDSGTQVGAACF